MGLDKGRDSGGYIDVIKDLHGGGLTSVKTFYGGTGECLVTIGLD